MAHIVVEGLNKSFGRHHVLKDVSLEIEEKEFVTLLGPSGCGKTTTLRLLAGFLVPDGGEIRVAGQLLSSPQTTVPPERRRMGMVFQNYAIWPHMSVSDNVAFGLKLARVGRAEIGQRVARVLAAVGLEGLEGRHPAQLSGGQQQRVALARSLVVEPSILLLDEPLSNLDAKLRERMRGELKSLQRDTGITFVYVTHDQAEAMALSDRIAVFHQGVLQQYGRPRTIYERPANLFVADFMGIVNRLPGEIVERRNGEVRVRVGDHVLAAIESGDGGSPTCEVTLAIRPESVRLGAPEGPGNRLDGSVVEATFLGSIVDYQIDVGGLLLRVQADRHVVQNVGSKVQLTIPIEECVAMPTPPQESP
jgi:ABC-type Fe3+/spermidine/putrescine transport system ATPase subunit